MSVWADATEEGILDFLEEAFRNFGYESVENFHKYDRRHENGVDIACKGFGKTIDLQAKIKPRQKDIAQLEKLAKSSASEKIYVYVEQPSRPFKKRMSGLIGPISFWDSVELHKFLISNRSQLYIRNMFLNCQLSRDINDTISKIFSYSNVNPKPIEPLILEQWWNFKDRAVKLHANLEQMELFWKDKLLSQDRHDSIILEKLLDEILISFSIIAKTCSEHLLQLVDVISKKQPSILSYYVVKVLESSSWIGMHMLKEKGGDPVKAKEIIHNWMLPTKNSASEYSLIGNYLTEYYHVGEAIEDGVDFVFNDFLEEQRAHGKSA